VDIPTGAAERLADKTRAEKKRQRGGKTRIGNLAQVIRDKRTVNKYPYHPSDTTGNKALRDAMARLGKSGRGAGGVGGIMGKLPK